MILSVCDKVEDIMRKGKSAGYQHFLLFTQCFENASFPNASKGVIVWEWVNTDLLLNFGSKLNFAGLPLIDSFNAYVVGDTIKLECKVIGHPLPSVTFTSQGQAVTGVSNGHQVQNNILAVENEYVKKEYTCTAANKYGSDSVTLTGMILTL